MRQFRKCMAFLVLMGLVCMACGTDGGKTENAQETAQVVISEIVYNKETMSYCISAKVDRMAVTDHEFLVAGAERTDIEKAEDGNKIRWYGFYNDESDLEAPKIYTDEFSSSHEKNAYENVVVLATPTEETEVKSFEEECNGVLVPIRITECTVSIDPAEEWRVEGAFYNVIATDTDGTDYLVCKLPGIDDRKASERKEAPLENDLEDVLEWLGGGYESAVQQEFCGIRFIMRDDIELDKIVSARIEKMN
ncbi:MAG: hypothetical protein NC180_00970 [Muribaculaceae bacterium]|nr:hypothetical protein [Roseburia sp.]MCM1431343.1 hypothetical protein [Muribaculaceae bacterium]MCM1491785.1 hypothetical protein [Muribaculaceae bacterium]